MQYILTAEDTGAKIYSQSHTNSIHKELESKVLLLSATHNDHGLPEKKKNTKKNFHITK